jgi:hypothetical protein
MIVAVRNKANEQRVGSFLGAHDFQGLTKLAR